MSRYIALCVDMFDHPVVGIDKPRHAMAWLWLIANAAWKPARREVAGKVFNLQRGQLIASRSYIAKKTGLSEQEVRTLLVKLSTHEMVSICNQGTNVITVCNYEKYQTREPASNQPSTSEQPAVNQSSTKDTKVTKEDNTPLPPKGGPTPFEALQAFEAYNATALRCGLPQASKLTKDRQRKIIARLKEHGADGWSSALANIERSAFLTGTNDRGWRINLDALLQPSTFGKVRDAVYGNGRHAAPDAKKPIATNADYQAHIARLINHGH